MTLEFDDQVVEDRQLFWREARPGTPDLGAEFQREGFQDLDLGRREILHGQGFLLLQPCQLVQAQMEKDGNVDQGFQRGHLGAVFISGYGGLAFVDFPCHLLLRVMVLQAVLPDDLAQIVHRVPPAVFLIV